MKPILVLYATREGQTRRIAERVGELIRERGQQVKVIDAASATPPFALGGYRAAVLAASVHAGEHESEMVCFVRGNRRELERLPAAFISVSLTEAGAEDAQGDERRREQASQRVEQQIEKFVEETGWHPARVKPVAGAVPYTQYGLLKRFFMKLIVKQQVGPTDTSVDHEYTDWAALQRFVDEFMTTAVESSATTSSPN